VGFMMLDILIKDTIFVFSIYHLLLKG